mmetsp:Transcript_27628/g.79380  ORF Transcript_27628/g.79380 Transcript_27628/m.79380 type:complete len:202 (-) Transcript_27628:366-971(-)
MLLSSWSFSMKEECSRPPKMSTKTASDTSNTGGAQRGLRRAAARSRRSLVMTGTASSSVPKRAVTFRNSRYAARCTASRAPGISCWSAIWLAYSTSSRIALFNAKVTAKRLASGGTLHRSSKTYSSSQPSPPQLSPRSCRARQNQRAALRKHMATWRGKSQAGVRSMYERPSFTGSQRSSASSSPQRCKARSSYRWMGFIL